MLISGSNENQSRSLTHLSSIRLATGVSSKGPKPCSPSPGLLPSASLVFIHLLVIRDIAGADRWCGLQECKDVISDPLLAFTGLDWTLIAL